jgi:ankyrin repeat protein
MQACDRGWLTAVDLLIKAGAEVNSRDSHGASALMWASHRGHGEIVRRLLEVPDLDLQIANQGGFTALKLAEFNQYPEVAAILKAAGATT